MVFSSLVFLYLFLPGTLLLYAIAPVKAKNAVLLILSLAFYFCGEQLKVLLMLGEIALTYAAGRLLDVRKGEDSNSGLTAFQMQKKKAVLVIFLTLSLALLFGFKYTGLLEDTVNAAAGRKLLGFAPPALPIGISFYTFQCMSYVIDVYRGDHSAEKNPVSLALYISFFPQLIAGPIVRYDTVADALKTREFNFTRFGKGAFRFTLGLGKKVLLADLLFTFASAGGSGMLLAWLQSIAYLFYVYFDFSGYSDMAAGLAMIFGFDIPENFNYPLISRSFREFWRRWHISLGSWFRDYLYIPLGGNRKGPGITIRNILLVWALTGLWHGASWNFVIWGLAFGVLLVLETLCEGRRKTGETDSPRRNSWLRVPFVLLMTVLIFVFFRFPDYTEAAAQFRKMFSGSFWTAESFYYVRSAAVLLVFSAFGATPLPKRLASRIFLTRSGQRSATFVQAVWMLLILLLVTASLVDGSFSPFLYFRF